MPKSLVDLETGLVRIKRPPSSGFYSIDYISDNIISLKKRVSSNHIPKTLTAIYLQEEKISDYLDFIQSNHVVELQEGFNFSKNFESKIKARFRKTGAVENWLNLLILDSESKAFSSELSRQLFAYEFRKTLSREGKKVTGSIIPEINSGYLALETLEKSYDLFKGENYKLALEELRKNTITISSQVTGFLQDSTFETAKRLGLKVVVSDKSNLRFKRVGLESLDIIHALKYVLLYSYPTQGITLPKGLQTKLSQIAKDQKELNQDFNRALFKNAIISPLMPYGRSQLLKKESTLSFPEQFLRQDWYRFFEKDKKQPKLSQEEKIINLLKKQEPTVINPFGTMPRSKPFSLIRIEAPVFDPAELLRTDFHSLLYALYSRPLEVSESGDYRSQILRSFVYNKKENKLILKLKKGLSFSNGDSLTAEDLALTIARVAYLKPKLETFKAIKGMEEWLASGDILRSLPSGIDVIGSHRIEISFNSPRKHPFYWLSLSIFSVIPKTSFDSRTGKLLVKWPAFSGAYSLVSNHDDILVLEKRSHNRSLPDRLNVIYPQNNFMNFSSYIGKKHLIDAQMPLFFNENYQEKLNQLKVSGTILNQSSGIVFDDKSIAFADKRVRQFFNAEMRKTIVENGLKSFGSIVPELSPGYVSLKDLEATIKPFSKKERIKFIEHLRVNPPSDFQGIRYNPLNIMYKVLKETCERLKIPLLKREDANIRFFIISSEPFDYPEYIKYTFEYGVSKFLRSKNLFNAAEKLNSNNIQSLLDFNYSLFEDAKAAPLLSHGRFQITHKNTFLKISDEPVIKQGFLDFFEGVKS